MAQEEAEAEKGTLIEEEIDVKGEAFTEHLRRLKSDSKIL